MAGMECSGKCMPLGMRPQIISRTYGTLSYIMHITSHRNGWPLDLRSLRHFEEPMSDAYGIASET